MNEQTLQQINEGLLDLRVKNILTFRREQEIWEASKHILRRIDKENKGQESIDDEVVTTSINSAFFELVVAGVIDFNEGESPKEAAKQICRRYFRPTPPVS